MQAELIISAVRPEQFPAEEIPEYAFLGRSNVGKSSLLNRLLARKNLARISSTPGCTQVINFYRVDGRMHFVDLPGYGYAKVPRALQSGWKDLVESYLLNRRSLKLCFLLMDARRGWKQGDIELRQWLEYHQRPYVVIATKVDKLNMKERNGLAALKREIPAGELVPFSAVTGQGAGEIWQAIRKT
jgi:GTP-binding protein